MELWLILYQASSIKVLKSITNFRVDRRRKNSYWLIDKVDITPRSIRFNTINSYSFLKKGKSDIRY